MQISPRPYLAMKLMSSGVVNWAGRQRSPSFSRSSSSVMITLWPRWNSAIASSTVANGFGAARALRAFLAVARDARSDDGTRDARSDDGFWDARSGKAEPAFC